MARIALNDGGPLFGPGSVAAASDPPERHGLIAAAKPCFARVHASDCRNRAAVVRQILQPVDEA